MRAIGDNIVELSVIALVAFFVWGIGYVITKEMKQTNARYEACIAADKQWIKGNCVR